MLDKDKTHVLLLSKFFKWLIAHGPWPTHGPLTTHSLPTHGPLTAHSWPTHSPLMAHLEKLQLAGNPPSVQHLSKYLSIIRSLYIIVSTAWINVGQR